MRNTMWTLVIDMKAIDTIRKKIGWHTMPVVYRNGHTICYWCDIKMLPVKRAQMKCFLFYFSNGFEMDVCLANDRWFTMNNGNSSGLIDKCLCKINQWANCQWLSIFETAANDNKWNMYGLYATIGHSISPTLSALSWQIEQKIYRVYSEPPAAIENKTQSQY